MSGEQARPKKREIEIEEEEPKGVVANITGQLTNFLFYVICSASVTFGVSVGCALWDRFGNRLLYPLHYFTRGKPK